MLINTIIFLFKTYASLYVISKFIFQNLTKKFRLSKYKNDHEIFLKSVEKITLQSDWNGENYIYWLKIFDEFGFKRAGKLNVLEIGSWEGLSASFILRTLENSKLTCVDTWQGSDERNANVEETENVLASIEANFDSNMLPFGERLTKFKGTSYLFFAKYTERNKYDLIYIDGSHHCDDVIIDAIKSFEQLKVGGIIIFDDYFWKHYSRSIDNPASAINLFLKLKSGSYKILEVYYQLIIQKTADRY